MESFVTGKEENFDSIGTSQPCPPYSGVRFDRVDCIFYSTTFVI